MGKKKPTKKELAEAEELRKKQEEEARQKEIQAKKERELYEQQQREALDALFKQQAPNLEEEIKSVNNMIQKLCEKWQFLESGQKDSERWSRYLACDALPNPSSESELNSYLSVWKEDFQPDFSMVTELMEKLDEVDQICNLLENEIANAADLLSPKEKILKKVSIEFRALINMKWDAITTSIYQNMDQFPIEENENFKFVAQCFGHKFGLWANSTKNPRFKSIDFPDLSISSSIPKPLSLSNVGIRMLLQTNPSCVRLFEENTDYRPVGAVLFFDLFELPPAITESRNWYVMQVTEEAKRLEYPFPKSAVDIIDDDPDSATSMMQWPAAVSYKIPNSFTIQHDAVALGWWDEKTKSWSTDGVEDIDIALSTGVIRFRSCHFAPTAVIQHAFAEYPIQGWTLSVTSPNEAKFVVQGKYTEIEIQIQGGRCQLIRPLEQLEEDQFKEKWMSPSYLLQNLSFCGINFIGPDERSQTTKPKSSEMMEQMAAGVSAFSLLFQFKCSPFNSQLDSTKAICQFRPLSEAVRDEASPWSALVLDSKFQTLSSNYMISYVLKEINSLEDIKFDTKNTATATVFHTMRGLEHSSSYDQVSEQSTEMVKTIYNLLRIVKPCVL